MCLFSFLFLNTFLGCQSILDHNSEPSLVYHFFQIISMSKTIANILWFANYIRHRKGPHQQSCLQEVLYYIDIMIIRNSAVIVWILQYLARKENNTWKHGTFSISPTSLDLATRNRSASSFWDLPKKKGISRKSYFRRHEYQWAHYIPLTILRK